MKTQSNKAKQLKFGNKLRRGDFWINKIGIHYEAITGIEGRLKIKRDGNVKGYEKGTKFYRLIK